MDTEAIERILDEGAFSGPSRLGPIADAIRDYSAGRSNYKGILQDKLEDATESKTEQKSSETVYTHGPKNYRTLTRTNSSNLANEGRKGCSL